jgi:YbgC/YbaW family acyl-CoA thioester hydrolase
MSTAPQTPFLYPSRIRLAQSDAGGVVFFTRPLELFHEAFEAFLDDRGSSSSVASILDAGAIALPIVEANEVLKAPLFVGDAVVVGISVERVGTSSFILRGTITRGDDVAVQTRTVHVCIDRKTRAKAALPTTLLAALATLPTAPAVEG